MSSAEEVLFLEQETTGQSEFEKTLESDSESVRLFDAPIMSLIV